MIPAGLMTLIMHKARHRRSQMDSDTRGLNPWAGILRTRKTRHSTWAVFFRVLKTFRYE